MRNFIASKKKLIRMLSAGNVRSEFTSNHIHEHAYWLLYSRVKSGKWWRIPPGY